MFCKYCGAEINNNAVVCVRCGCQITPIKNYDSDKSDKSGVAALLLCFFFGCLGIHSFYVGRIGAGFGQLFTLGGLGIWAFVDFIMIAVGSYKDSEGKFVKI